VFHSRRPCSGGLGFHRHLLSIFSLALPLVGLHSSLIRHQLLLRLEQGDDRGWWEAHPPWNRYGLGGCTSRFIWEKGVGIVPLLGEPWGTTGGCRRCSLDLKSSTTLGWKWGRKDRYVASCPFAGPRWAVPYVHVHRSKKCSAHLRGIVGVLLREEGPKETRCLSRHC
jgi:hypothetical protein